MYCWGFFLVSPGSFACSVDGCPCSLPLPSIMMCLVFVSSWAMKWREELIQKEWSVLLPTSMDHFRACLFFFPGYGYTSELPNNPRRRVLSTRQACLLMPAPLDPAPQAASTLRVVAETWREAVQEKKAVLDRWRRRDGRPSCFRFQALTQQEVLNMVKGHGYLSKWTCRSQHRIPKTPIGYTRTIRDHPFPAFHQ